MLISGAAQIKKKNILFSLVTHFVNTTTSGIIDFKLLIKNLYSVFNYENQFIRNDFFLIFGWQTLADQKGVKTFLLASRSLKTTRSHIIDLNVLNKNSLLCSLFSWHFSSSSNLFLGSWIWASNFLFKAAHVLC